MAGLPVIFGALFLATALAPLMLSGGIVALTALASRPTRNRAAAGRAWASSAWILIAGSGSIAVRGLPDLPAALVVVALAVATAVLLDEARVRLVAG